MTATSHLLHDPNLAAIGARDTTPPPIVRWSPPTPRDGLAGVWDRFVGPGATRGEVWLQTAIPLAAAVFAGWWPVASGHDWPGWQSLVAGLLALDTVGGVITNSTHTAKRWYHRAGQTAADHLGFVAIHVIQLGLVAWLFRGGDWVFLITAYAALLAGSALIVWSPKLLQKPVALGVYLVTLVAGLAPAAVTPGLEWFAPVFFLKLFVAHLPFEAPLAPATHPSRGA
ncbi:MAG: hypothetical protein AAGE94_00690 [Acidobacteriota bacterium]